MFLLFDDIYFNLFAWNNIFCCDERYLYRIVQEKIECHKFLKATVKYTVSSSYQKNIYFLWKRIILCVHLNILFAGNNVCMRWPHFIRTSHSLFVRELGDIIQYTILNRSRFLANRAAFKCFPVILDACPSYNEMFRYPTHKKGVNNCRIASEATRK